MKFLKKFRFWSKYSKFRKISILIKFLKKFRFWSNYSKFRKISILVKFSKKFRFGSNFQKDFDFSQIFGNFDFSHISNKKSILVKISKKIRFWSKFSKNFDFGQNFQKIRLLWKFRKYSNIEIFEKNSILLKNFDKMPANSLKMVKIY